MDQIEIKKIATLVVLTNSMEMRHTVSATKFTPICDAQVRVKATQSRHWGEQKRNDDNVAIYWNCRIEMLPRP